MSKGLSHILKLIIYFAPFEFWFLISLWT